MNISPKRMAQIESEPGLVDELERARKIFLREYADCDFVPVQLFICWLATDPTPPPPTVADLDEADRLGFKMLEAGFPLNQTLTEDVYFGSRDRPGNNEIRGNWNRAAAAVVTELRAIMRERGDVVVPGDRDEDADAERFGEVVDVRYFIGKATVGRGIRAVLAHHAEREVQP